MLTELEAKLVSGERFTRADAARVLESADLVAVGVLGESARRAITGDRVTFGRVTVVDGPTLPAQVGEAGEVRLTASPATIAEARAQAQAAVVWAGSIPVTAYTLADLQTLAGHDRSRLETLARELAGDGVAAVAEARVDASESDDALIAAIQAVTGAGLGVWRLTIGEADAQDRLALIERAAAVQNATRQIRAFAPLPRIDRRDAPSTGYDDVKTVTIARLLCRDIEHIQVDWPLYGPKLAQVAVAFGANDIDGVASIDTLALGPRRTPIEDIRRQVQAAGATPMERDARYVARG